MDGKQDKTSKTLVIVLLALLSLVAGWEGAGYVSAQEIQSQVDLEVQRQVGPQLATINQKLSDIENELNQIAQFSVKR